MVERSRFPVIQDIPPPVIPRAVGRDAGEVGEVREPPFEVTVTDKARGGAADLLGCPGKVRVIQPILAGAFCRTGAAPVIVGKGIGSVMDRTATTVVIIWRLGFDQTKPVPVVAGPAFRPPPPGGRQRRLPSVV